MEQDIVEVLLGGLHQWRPDLDYPESHSDMNACVMNLMVLFEIKRRVVPFVLPIKESIV